MYRELDSTAVVATLDKLLLRIHQRFPDSGLAAVAGELKQAAEESRERIRRLSEPNWRIRWIIGAVIAVGAVAAVAVVMLGAGLSTETDLADALQAIDSALSIVLLVGGSLFFLFQWEERGKRAVALDALEEIRSLVHVIDMHQLTKDPGYRVAAPTPDSPVRTLGPELMIRYLDYCSELLSLAAKVAALYAQNPPSSEVLEAVSDIEQLAGSLSQKIWQKITITQGALP